MPFSLRLKLALAPAVSFQQFAGVCLFLSVEDGGGLFIVFPLFKFANDAFFFYHAFKAFDGFFKNLVVINGNVRQN